MTSGEGIRVVGLASRRDSAQCRSPQPEYWKGGQETLNIRPAIPRNLTAADRVGADECRLARQLVTARKYLRTSKVLI